MTLISCAGLRNDLFGPAWPHDTDTIPGFANHYKPISGMIARGPVATPTVPTAILPPRPGAATRRRGCNERGTPATERGSVTGLRCKPVGGPTRYPHAIHTQDTKKTPYGQSFVSRRRQCRMKSQASRSEPGTRVAARHPSAHANDTNPDAVMRKRLSTRMAEVPGTVANRSSWRNS